MKRRLYDADLEKEREKEHNEYKVAQNEWVSKLKKKKEKDTKW